MVVLQHFWRAVLIINFFKTIFAAEKDGGRRGFGRRRCGRRRGGWRARSRAAWNTRGNIFSTLVDQDSNHDQAPPKNGGQGRKAGGNLRRGEHLLFYLYITNVVYYYTSSVDTKRCSRRSQRKQKAGRQNKDIS